MNTTTTTSSYAAVSGHGLEAFEHGYAQVNGCRLHYVTGGNGPPVLLIPGFPQTWFVWRHVMIALKAAGFQVIAVDPRGIGESGRPASGYDMASAAVDMQTLMTQLGHERYNVVGHDVGMWIGYALASDFTESVERIVLIDASIPGVAQAAPVIGPPEKNKFRWHFLFNQMPDLPELLIEGRERAYLHWMFDQWAFRRGAVAIETYVGAYATPGALRAGLAYYRAIPETCAQNARRVKQKLAMPVLAIGGEHSAGDGTRAMMEPITSDLRGKVIPGCGHIVPEECPGELIEHLLPFLRGD